MMVKEYCPKIPKIGLPVAIAPQKKYSLDHFRQVVKHLSGCWIKL
jgi:hypothetical protein